MIIDARSEFADNVALGTAGTGRQLVGNQIDRQVAGLDVGIGQPIYLNIRVTTAVTSGGAATVSFEFVSDAAAAIATDGSATTHLTTEAFALADLAAGANLVQVALPISTSYERYLGIIANVGTAALTDGAIDAFITLDPQGWKAYPDAVN